MTICVAAKVLTSATSCRCAGLFAASRCLKWTTLTCILSDAGIKCSLARRRGRSPYFCCVHMSRPIHIPLYVPGKLNIRFCWPDTVVAYTSCFIWVTCPLVKQDAHISLVSFAFLVLFTFQQEWTALVCVYLNRWMCVCTCLIALSCVEMSILATDLCIVSDMKPWVDEYCDHW